MDTTNEKATGRRSPPARASLGGPTLPHMEFATTKQDSLIHTPKSIGCLSPFLMFSSSSSYTQIGTTVCACGRPFIARAAVLWSWGGSIPRRRTNGLDIKKGVYIDICNVINTNWFQACHEARQCSIVPECYLRVLSIYDERYRTWLPSSISEHLPVVQNPMHQRPSRFSRLSCFSASTFDENDRPSPPLPPPPFPKEAYEAVKDGSRISVAVECQSLPHLGIVISFKLILTPAEGCRYTGLTFDAVLPNGYQIVGISPENHKGNSTAIRECHFQTEVELDRPVTGDPLALDRPFSGSERVVVTRKVEYTRVTKSTIRGGGVNTTRATWAAEEDIGGKSGLEERMDLKILLKSHTSPPTIKYMYTLEIDGGVGTQRTAGSTDNAWTSPWMQETLP